jgi:Uma2 family endonuclease
LLRLVSALFRFVSASRIGEVFAAPFDVVLSEHDVVEPDILFVSTARGDIVTPLNVQGAPDLVVEILSSNRRYDKRVKYEMYERARVAAYWIVDPDDEFVEVYRHDGRHFVRTNVGDTLTSPLLPGFDMNVRDLFI